jgi:hypothetical protein
LANPPILQTSAPAPHAQRENAEKTEVLAFASVIRKHALAAKTLQKNVTV